MRTSARYRADGRSEVQKGNQDRKGVGEKEGNGGNKSEGAGGGPLGGDALWGPGAVRLCKRSPGALRPGSCWPRAKANEKLGRGYQKGGGTLIRCSVTGKRSRRSNHKQKFFWWASMKMDATKNGEVAHKPVICQEAKGAQWGHAAGLPFFPLFSFVPWSYFL